MGAPGLGAPDQLVQLKSSMIFHLTGTANKRIRIFRADCLEIVLRKSLSVGNHC
jgi:hypothetical protein